MRISDWSSDVCSSDLAAIALGVDRVLSSGGAPTAIEGIETLQAMRARAGGAITVMAGSGIDAGNVGRLLAIGIRSEEHTSELQSLMRISYAVFCLKTKTHSYKIYSHILYKNYQYDQYSCIPVTPQNNTY